MKKLIALSLLSMILITFCVAATKFEYYPMNIKVKSLLKEPTTESDAAFVFPIDVTLTGISKDKKWFRFKVAYDLVFFGKYEFEGWTNVNPWGPFDVGATPEAIMLK